MSQDNESQPQSPVQASEPQPELRPSPTAKKIKPWLVIFAGVNIAFLTLNIGVGLSWKKETIRQVEKATELVDRERKLETSEKDLEEAQKIIEQLAAQTKQHADESEANRVKSENALLETEKARRETEASLARIKSIKKSVRH